MPIMRRVSGQWVEVDNTYAFGVPTGQRRRVYAAYLYQSNLSQTPPPPHVTPRPMTATRHKIFDFSQKPPAMAKPTGTNSGHTSATISWTAVPAAKGYRVYMRDGTSTTPVKSALLLAGVTSYVWSGLAINHTYHFSVVMTNDFGIESVESPQIHFASGHPEVYDQNPKYPAAEAMVELDSSATDTWEPNLFWNQWNNKVVQGYYSVSGAAAHRARGCVRYSTLYSQLVTKYGTARADHMEVMDAVIRRVYRDPQGTGGTQGWQVNVYPCNVNFASNAMPVGVSNMSYSYFVGPVAGAVKDNFKLASPTLLTYWANDWIDKVPRYNGLVIWRGDTSGSTAQGYAGYTVFRGRGAIYEWKLGLNLRWRYRSVTYLAPIWS